MRRLLSNVFFLAGFVLLAAAAGAYFTPADAPGATVEGTERELPDLTVGENVVTYRLLNPTSHPVRVVGCTSNCGRNCCVKSKRALPFDILPGGAVDLEIALETMRPGRVETQFEIFLDDMGFRQFVVTVRGEAKAP